MTATIKDVARVAGVSVASVSRALNGHDNVTDETRQRILEAAGELRYVPHAGARSLITRRTQTIGVLLPDLHGEFFSELIRGIDSAARATRPAPARVELARRSRPRRRARCARCRAASTACS